MRASHGERSVSAHTHSTIISGAMADTGTRRLLDLASSFLLTNHRIRTRFFWSEGKLQLQPGLWTMKKIDRGNLWNWMIGENMYCSIKIGTGQKVTFPSSLYPKKVNRNVLFRSWDQEAHVFPKLRLNHPSNHVAFFRSRQVICQYWCADFVHCK